MKAPTYWAAYLAGTHDAHYLAMDDTPACAAWSGSETEVPFKLNDADDIDCDECCEIFFDDLNSEEPE